MREIKFRAWDKDTGKPIMSDEIPLSGEPSECLEIGGQDWIIVEQYTGLKDGNGVEIFEGDIVKFFSKSYGVFSAPIRWHVEKGMLAVCTHGGWGDGFEAKQIEMPQREWDRKHDPCHCDGAMYTAWYRPLGDNLDKIEVIGNIHENPELLEEP
jgi:hypothetical protein